MISGLASWLQLTASDSKERKPGVRGGEGGEAGRVRVEGKNENLAFFASVCLFRKLTQLIILSPLPSSAPNP